MSKNIMAFSLISKIISNMFYRRNELVNIDERKQKAALKEFYDNEALKQKNERRIQSLKTFSKIVNPMFCIAFVFVFWAVGLHQSFKAI